MNTINRIIVTLAALTVGAPAYAKDCQAGTAGWWQQEAAIMRTTVRVELQHKDAAAACVLINDVLDEVRRIDNVVSPSKPESILSQLNRYGSDRAVFIGGELYGLIEQSIDISELADGAFDVTRTPGTQARQPEDALSRIDYQHLVLSESMHTVRFATPGIRIDLGGLASGYAVDRGIAILARAGITDAVVSVGGDMRIMGNRAEDPLTVGIAGADVTAPRFMPLEDVAVSVSGGYEKFHSTELARDAVAEIDRVTVIGASTLMTDALSTTVFLLGTEEGLRLIEVLEDYDAIVVKTDGSVASSERLTQFAQRSPATWSQ